MPRTPRHFRQPITHRSRALARAELIAACVILVALTTLAVVTFVALRGEREQTHARQQAEQMDRLRRSLWRMDSQLTSIIAREAARSPEQYLPFYPADRTQALNLSEQFSSQIAGRELAAGASPQQADDAGSPSALQEPAPSVLVPSLLLTQPDDVTKLHFQISPSGDFASPQVPLGRQREFAQLRFTTPYAIEHAETKLRELQTLYARQDALRHDAMQLARAQQAASPRSRVSARQDETASKTADAEESAFRIASAGDASNTQTKEQADTRATAGSPSSSTAQAPSTTGTSAPPVVQASAQAPGAPNNAPSNPIRLGNAAPSAPEPAPSAAPDGQPRTEGAPPSQAPPPGQGTMQAQADFAARQSLARAANVKPEAPVRSTSSRAADAAGNADLLLEAVNDEALPSVVSQPAVRQEGFVPEWILREPATTTGSSTTGSTTTGNSSTPPALPELVFTRTVEGPFGAVRQGFWLDWPVLHAQLLASVEDTAPGAMLRPVLSPAGTSAGLPTDIPDDVLGRMLATVPAELVLPTLAPAPQPWTPLRTALVATWLLVLAAMLTLAWLARAADKLAENRGRFVTAVTHELRTPLTSFCLYSQMLADGMVQDEDAKRDYARTLHAQSLRLSRIVESVLDYARLGRARRSLSPTTVGALRERIEPPLMSICRRSGLALTIVPPPAGWERAALRTDLDNIDRILTNLIDNACKYASDGPDARVELAWLIEGQTLVARVRDFGPGIPAGDRDRIFKAFERGSAHAGSATPGLGLGLALSHALAQEIGATLRLLDLPANDQGAAFELRMAMYA
jgi:signal transduction histidine kinase